MNTTTQILEGPRLEPDMNVKLDTSLEADLQLDQSNTGLTPYSGSSDIIDLDRRNCCHNKFIAQGSFDTCFHCGAFVLKNGAKTLKSNKASYSAFFPPKTIYETMTRRSNKYTQSLNPEYSLIRQTYVEWILELADKLRISANSSHLAILILDIIMFRDTSLTSKLQLYSPICLFIAAKAIELDERIPFIPKLRRYANPTFSVDDYRKAELHVLDMIDWNPLFSTALEINEFLMVQGILFSTDAVEDNSEKLKPAAEGLRENIQHKKDTEMPLSPGSKENNESSYSDVSTSGATGDNLSTPLTPGVALSEQSEEHSPEMLTLPLHDISDDIEIANPTHSMIAIENKVEEIMSHFESNYTKLSTLLLRDIKFIQWEPKVVSAAIVAFFRQINKITPVWNEGLETITQLQFTQISTCFDLICKKYSTTFNLNTHKILHVLQTLENQGGMASEWKTAKANTTTNEKFGCLQLKSELLNKTHLSKPTFSHQVKAILTSNIPTTSAYSTHMRDDLLRGRARYANGTFSTEILQRNFVKNPGFIPSHFANQEQFANNSSKSNTTASTSTTTASGFVDFSHAVSFLNDHTKDAGETEQKLN